jgi:hypothetical protein
MTKTIAMMCMAAALVVAQDKKSEGSQPAKDAAALPSVPAGAKEVGPNLYKYTDAQGKTWMYRKTPFGVGKWEDKPSEQPAASETVPTKVTDLGDSYQFQRPTPFGIQKWVVKKSDLNDFEKTLVEKAGPGEQQPAGTSKTQPAAKTTEKF